MPRDLRWYLFVRTVDGSTTISVHHGSSEVFKEWAKHQTGDTRPEGFLFAGEARPDLSEVEQLLGVAPGRFLVSESARWLLPNRYEVVTRPIGQLAPAAGYQGMPVFSARLGWGYELPADLEGDHRFRVEQGFSDAVAIDHQREQERFLQALEGCDAGDPFKIARIAPAWSHCIKLETLTLTVRCSNVLRHQKIIKIADLALFTVDEAMKWLNFGRKSVADLSTCLIQFLKAGTSGSTSHSNPTSPCPRLGAPEREAVQVDINSLTLEINRTISDLPPKDRAVVEGRLAISGPKRTLEAIASDLHLTRERVRQIEARFLKVAAVRAPLVRHMLTSLDRLRNGRGTPLYADLLEAEDPWFSGSSDRLSCIVELVERFGTGRHKICWIQGRPVVTSIDSAQWDVLKTTVLDYLRSRIGMGMTKVEVDLAFGGFLDTHGCPELISEFAAEISEYLHFGRPHQNGEEHLIGVGRSLARHLRGMLEKSDGPLHYVRLHALYVGTNAVEISVRNVHAAVSRAGALYYGRGVFGTWRHFPLPGAIREQILGEIEDVIAATTHQKQWHIAELLTLLNEYRPDLPDGLNKYVLNIILGTSSILKPVGRFVWSGLGGIGSTTLDRIEILNTCLNILARAGGPMTTSEIKEELSRVRGVGEYFLLQPNEKVSRVAPDTWGLLDRDFYLSREQRRGMLNALAAYLDETDRGVHISEINAITLRYMQIPDGFTPYMMLSSCQTDPRLKVYKGQFLGLRGWGESRRMTIADALDRDVSLSGGPLSMGEIVDRVSRSVGRCLTGQEVVNPLRLKGFLFDGDQKLWYPPSADVPDDDGEAEEPEDAANGDDLWQEILN